MLKYSQKSPEINKNKLEPRFNKSKMQYSSKTKWKEQSYYNQITS